MSFDFKDARTVLGFIAAENEKYLHRCHGAEHRMLGDILQIDRYIQFEEHGRGIAQDVSRILHHCESILHMIHAKQVKERKLLQYTWERRIYPLEGICVVIMTHYSASKIGTQLQPDSGTNARLLQILARLKTENLGIDAHQVHVRGEGSTEKCSTIVGGRLEHAQNGFIKQVDAILKNIDINYEYLRLHDNDPNKVYTELQMKETESLDYILRHYTKPFDGLAAHRMLLKLHEDVQEFKTKRLRDSDKYWRAVEYVTTIKKHTDRLLGLADLIRLMQRPPPP
jgi:hypothetical protein